jgi:hypothetical protein
MDPVRYRTVGVVMFGLALALSTNAIAQNETKIPGKQVMVAHYGIHP